MRAYHILISVHASPNNTFIPASLFQQLPAQPPKSTARRNALYNSAHKDYRYGPIRVDWVDFDSMSKSLGIGKEPQKQGGPATATFVPQNHSKSGSINLPEGIVHLLRDSLKSSSSDNATPSTDVSNAGGLTLAVLAVPSWMTPSDFLAFVAPAAEGIAHLRMVRDSVPNRSMVIIKFRRLEDVQEFAEVYNGRPFNSMEPEICHVVHVLSVNIEKDDAVALAIARLSSTQGSTYELPTCPVCLERMDSAVTGLVTVPCSHTFHCMCLSKWGDSRCPVCRYSQTLLSSHPSSSSSTRTIPFASPSIPALSTCADCASSTNLWICLICGNVGCGRYGRAHAHAHYDRTTHLYALELETQRVWDYAGDGYVHRLIQNKADGKLVELPSASSMAATGAEGDGGLGPGRADALNAEKIEAIGIEYSYLLTSQLDSQRAYYEEQAGALKVKLDEMCGMVEKLGREVETQRTTALAEEERRRREEEERRAESERERVRLERKADRVAELARKLEKELREERAVSEGLLKNLGKMKERAEKAEKEKAEHTLRVAELEDEVRDVMFYLDAKTKIEEGGGVESEAAGGSIELPPPPLPTASRKKKQKK